MVDICAFLISRARSTVYPLQIGLKKSQPHRWRAALGYYNIWVMNRKEETDTLGCLELKKKKNDVIELRTGAKLDLLESF